MRRAQTGAPRTLAAIPAAAAVLNAAAAIALATVLAPGVSLRYGPVNAAYVAAHLGPWRAGWMLWIAAALSLLAFFAWWAVRCRRPAVARVALVISAIGVAVDVMAETRLIAWSADLDVSAALRQSGVLANACYSLAGALLMSATAWRPRILALWGWAIWILGAGLSVAAAASSDGASTVLSVMIFALLVPWLLAVGRTRS